MTMADHQKQGDLSPKTSGWWIDNIGSELASHQSKDISHVLRCWCNPPGHSHIAMYDKYHIISFLFLHLPMHRSVLSSHENLFCGRTLCWYHSKQIFLAFQKQNNGTECQNNSGWKGPLEVTYSNEKLGQANFTVRSRGSGLCTTQFQKISRDGNSTISMGNLYWCLVSFVVKLSQNYYQVSNMHSSLIVFWQQKTNKLWRNIVSLSSMKMLFILSSHLWIGCCSQLQGRASEITC